MVFFQHIQQQARNNIKPSYVQRLLQSFPYLQVLITGVLFDSEPLKHLHLTFITLTFRKTWKIYSASL